MRVESIKLHNFRNYENLELSFDSSRNIILGENAQGKTNLIEAIYLCAFARSFRTHNSQELIKIGETGANVTIEAISNEIECNISITIDKNGRKMIKKDNKILRRTADLFNNIVVVVFSPEDLRIIKDSPDKRRNFINKELCQIRPKYYDCLHNYNEVLKQKNTLLKDRNYNNEDGMLDIFDMQLEKYGVEIIRYRKKFIEKLSERANEIQNNISGGREELKIEYNFSVDEVGFYDKLVESRESDMYRGHSGVGPHRDDIEFYINGKDAKKYGSQGQQRTIALSLKLAEIQIARETIGESPILLLDDVLSELDYERQSFLFSEIEDVQLFITSTEVSQNIIEKMPNGSIYRVSDGIVTKNP